MKKFTSHLPAAVIILVFCLMAAASYSPKRVTYSKPVTYPCIQHPPLTYYPILLKINIDANYTMKDLSAVRESDPAAIMNALYNLNSSYKLADGVTPNLIMYITYTNDGYNHYGAMVRVDWQGQATFSFTLSNNYVTVSTLINDMTKKFNEFIVYGWHSGNCN